MCGRFSLHTLPETIAQHFQVPEVPFIERHYNIAPTQDIPVVRAAGEGREMVPLRWGLVPFWSREPKTGYSMINARAETVAAKPAYRAAFRRRRCLIPADGFYEWRAGEDRKQPYHIRMKHGDVFAFAGLWEHWEGNGRTVESCTIIVTAANELIRPIHDRMPVILDPANYGQWLDPDMQKPESLMPLLRPFPAGHMIAYPVSRRVNSPRNDDQGCIEPADD
jgi:putative SOS response-associated peptidase YedK